MNERIRELAEQCYNLPDIPEALYYRKFDEEKFAELIYKDTITVVAAQALSNHSALEVFLNLTRIYEGSKE